MTDATNALLPCPCGKTPTALVIVQHGDSKHAHCAGNCCGEWEVEFRTNFHHPTSAEAKRRAVSRWNDAHRQPTASAGMVVVPREPTEAMLDAGRTAVMARDCSGPKWGPADHFEATGFDTTGIPSRLLEGRYKMSKEWGAELVYAAMLAAHESQQKPRVNVGTIGHVSRDKSTLVAALTKVVSPPADTAPDVSERIPSKERGCDGKTDFGSHYESAARSLSKRHCKRYGVYRCPHCQGTHLTTKLEKADQYAPLLYVTPEPAENVDGE